MGCNSVQSGICQRFYCFTTRYTSCVSHCVSVGGPRVCPTVYPLNTANILNCMVRAYVITWREIFNSSFLCALKLLHCLLYSLEGLGILKLTHLLYWFHSWNLHVENSSHAPVIYSRSLEGAWKCWTVRKPEWRNDTWSSLPKICCFEASRILGYAMRLFASPAKTHIHTISVGRNDHASRHTPVFMNSCRMANFD